MNMGEVIRSNRLKQGLSQHTVANYLGVTASAVSKWECGKAFPDVTLLAPIARLLLTSLEDLLCFAESLSDRQIDEYTEEVHRRLKVEPFETVLSWTKGLIETYPACSRLILGMAAVLESHNLTNEGPDAGKFDGIIERWYEQVLLSQEAGERQGAAERLFHLYLRKSDYKKAQEILVHFFPENPESKRKQALLFAQTQRGEAAFRAYEEMLFAAYQSVSGVLQDLLILSLKEKNLQKAHMLVKKQVQLADVFDMGLYYQASPRLELAVLEQDVQTTVETMKAMLDGIAKMDHFTESPLYAHMKFQKIRQDYLDEVKKNLGKYMQDDHTFNYMKEHDEWNELKASVRGSG